MSEEVKQIKDVVSEVTDAPKPVRTVEAVNADYAALCTQIGDKHVKLLGIRKEAELSIEILQQEIKVLLGHVALLSAEMTSFLKKAE